MSQNTEELKIDIEEIIAKKNKKLLKWLPGFIINYIKRIIHQDEINEFLKEAKDYLNEDFVDKSIEFVNVNYVLHGLENIPDNDRYVFVSNHPNGGVEGLVLLTTIGRKYKSGVKSIINDVLMNLKNLNGLFIPVNNIQGKNSREYVLQVDKTYASDSQIFIFPSGLVSRRIGKRIYDLPWQKSFIAKSIKYQRSIVPVFVESKNSKWFYNLGYYRKKLGIKANLEMFYLVDEMFKQRGKTMHIYFGKPISFKELDKSKTHQEWAIEIQEKAYSLAPSGNLN